MRIEDKASQPSLRRLGVNVQGTASQDASASEAPEQRERVGGGARVPSEPR